MKQKKYSLSLLSILISIGCMGSFSINAQLLDRSVVAAAGQNFSTPAYSLQFTLGEPVSGTLINGEEISQGFQQEWLVVTAVDDAKEESLAASVYPNPTLGRVNIETGEPLDIMIFDAMGKSISATSVSSGKNEINIAQFAPGFYVMVLQSKAGNKTSTFKLQKVE